MRAPYQVLVVPYRFTLNVFQFAALKRADMGVWQFVAGGGKDDEEPENAAARELGEELGVQSLSLMQLQTVSSIPKIFFKARQYWPNDLYVVKEYAFSANCGNTPTKLSAEHSELKWGSFDEIYDLLKWDSNRTALWELNERLRNIK